MANEAMKKSTTSVSSWWEERSKILASISKPKPTRVRAKVKKGKAKRATKARRATKTKKVTRAKKTVKAKRTKRIKR